MKPTVELDRGPRSLIVDLTDLEVEARKNVLQVLRQHKRREALLRAEVSRLQEQLRVLGVRTPPGESTQPSHSLAHEWRPS